MVPAKSYEIFSAIEEGIRQEMINPNNPDSDIDDVDFDKIDSNNIQVSFYDYKSNEEHVYRISVEMLNSRIVGESKL